MSDTTHDDLVKRLSLLADSIELGDKLRWGEDSAALREAKDRIEELEAKLEAALQDADEAEAYAWELEQRLAKAADVIEWALICWDDHNKHGYNMQGDWVFDARATLAALKGQDDE